MLNLLKGIFYFGRELIFDHRREYDFSSPDFDGRKMTFLICLILSVALNIVVLYRAWDMAQEAIQHTDELDKLHRRIRYLEVEHEIDSVTIKTLQSIPEKNRRMTPSDEGRVRRQ